MTRGEVRAQMVSTTARLLAENGPTGATLGEVIRSSGAPRGSTYHHFPQGKRELYAAALDLASERALAYLDDARGEPAEVVMERFLTMWRTMLTRHDLELGCAVLAVAVAAEEPESAAKAGAIFRTWRGHLAALLVAGGLERLPAEAMAALAIAAAEGAVAIARAEGSVAVFDTVAEQVLAMAATAPSS